MKLLLIMVLLVCNVAGAEPYQMENSETKRLKDSATHREYNLYIKLPEGYSQNHQYPVVYTTDAWYTFPIVAGAVQVPMATEKMKKVIVVGISGDLSLDRDTSRIRDFTPTTPKAWKKQSGEADKFINFISEDVFSYIDKTYSTDENQRTFVGVSLGAMFGAYVLLNYSDIFDNYVLASPALWFDDGYIFELEEKRAKRKEEIDANVYVSVGSLEVLKGNDFSIDMVSDARKFYNALKSRKYKKLKIKNAVVESANHEISFPTSSIMGLYWLYGEEP